MTEARALVPNAGKWLKTRLGAATEQVTLCSAWVGDVPWETLGLDKLQEEVPLTVAFRWPRTAAEARGVNAAALLRLADRATLRSLDRPLHAKIYVVDDHAYVGSANLTLPGLGVGAGEPNLEVGLGLQDAELAAELRQWVDEHAPRSPTRDCLEKLAKWIQELPPGEAQDDPPQLVLEPEPPVEPAFARLVEGGVVVRYLGHAAGQGRGFESVEARSTRTRRQFAKPCSVQVSDSTHDRAHPERGFHFELTGQQVQRSRPQSKRRSPRLRAKDRLHALVLVPRGPDGGLCRAGTAMSRAEPPVVWLELSRLVGGAGPIPLSRLPALSRQMRIYLQEEGDTWVLRAASKPRGKLDWTLPLTVVPTATGPVAWLR